MTTCSNILAWEIGGQKSLAGYSPWGCKQSDMTEQLTLAHFFPEYILWNSIKKKNSYLREHWFVKNLLENTSHLYPS